MLRWCKGALFRVSWGGRRPTGSSTLFLSGVFCRCEDGAFGRGDQTAGLGMLFGIIHHREWEWWLLSSLSVRSFLLSYYGTMSHDNIIY
jgi:hypothetical protein